MDDLRVYFYDIISNDDIDGEVNSDSTSNPLYKQILTIRLLQRPRTVAWWLPRSPSCWPQEYSRQCTRHSRKWSSTQYKPSPRLCRRTFLRAPIVEPPSGSKGQTLCWCQPVQKVTVKANIHDKQVQWYQITGQIWWSYTKLHESVWHCWKHSFIIFGTQTKKLCQPKSFKWRKTFFFSNQKTQY